MSTPWLSRSCCASLTLLCSTCVFSQTSSNLVQTDPAAQYNAVRGAMQQLYDAGALRSSIGLHGSKSEYDLRSCNEPSDFIGQSLDSESREPLPLLIDVAAIVTIWRSDFGKLGVPERVWGAAVTDFENSQVKTIVRRGKELDDDQVQTALAGIASELNSYRDQTSDTLPKFIVEGGCGAGEVSVRVTLRPSNGQVLFIPAFSYELCKRQRLNPDDPRLCNRWTEAVEGLVMYVSGDYYYAARWPDGTTRNGKLGFNSPNQDGTTLVIQKP
jgi:hypothetical protein